MQAHSAVRFFRFLSLYTISSPSFPAKSVAQVSNNNKNNKTKQNKPKNCEKPTNKQYRCQRNAQKSGSEVQISRLKEHCFILSPKEQENLERCLYREARLLFGGKWGRGRGAYKQQFPVFEVNCFIEKNNEIIVLSNLVPSATLPATPFLGAG